MYFVWIELELLLARPQRICGEKVQGFNELLDNIGHSWCADTDSPLLIDSGSAVPIIRNNRNAKEAWHWILER